MANRGKRSPLSDPGPSGTVQEVLQGALSGSRGGVFPGSACELSSQELRQLDGPALRDPLTQILLGTMPDMALVFLQRTGLLGGLLPEVTAMVDFRDEHERHKDLWTHTITVVAQVQSTPVLRWAALLHDIGKIKTRSFDERGKVHFFGHEVAGARMFKRIARRLDFPPSEADRMRFLIRNHLRAGQYEPDWTDSAVRRFGQQMGSGLDDLIALSRADITTRSDRKRNRHLELLDELVQRLQSIRAQDAIAPALPKGLGNVLMERFGMDPGPALGRVMTALKARVEDGELPRGAEHEVYLDFLGEHTELMDPDK